MKFVFALVFLCTFPTIESKFSCRVNKVDCTSSGETATKWVCQLKAYNRRNPLLNVDLTLNRLVSEGLVCSILIICSLLTQINKRDFQISLSIFRKSVDRYNQIVAYTDLRLCRVLRGADSAMKIPFLQSLLQVFKDVAGDFTEICDRPGNFKVSNISLQDISLLALYPSGEYRSTIKIFDATDDNILNITLITKLGE